MKAVLSLTALMMLGAGAGEVHAASKTFSLKVTPGGIGQNAPASLQVILTNTSTDGHKLGSANVDIPSELTVTQVGAPSSGTGTLNGRRVELRNLSLTGGKSATFDVLAKAPDTEQTLDWFATAKSSQTYAEKDTPWGVATASTNVDSTNQSTVECPGGVECSLNQRHTVDPDWVQKLKNKKLPQPGTPGALQSRSSGEGSDVAESPTAYWVETTVTTTGAGKLSLRYLNPTTEAEMNTASACNGGIEQDPLLWPPYIEPSDAAALYDGPNAAKTVHYEISAELWQLVAEAGGRLDACFSAPFVFASVFPDPPFAVGDTTWFNGVLPDCLPGQQSGPCVVAKSPPANGDPAKVTIVIQPVIGDNTDPMNR